jgi:hypothetical protein
VKTERILQALGVVCLLGLGLLVARFISQPEAEREAFGGVLWRTRPFDLVLQLTLMLVGALGIRVLLPSEDED